MSKLQPSDLTKRKRTEVSVVQKKQICQWRLANPGATIEATREYARNTLHIVLGRSTINDIWRARKKWLAVPLPCSSFRIRPAVQERLESALAFWMADVTSRGLVLTDPIIIEKAKVFGDELGVTGFAYSRGWLSRFKKRHSLSRQLHPESINSIMNNTYYVDRPSSDSESPAYLVNKTENKDFISSDTDAPPCVVTKTESEGYTSSDTEAPDSGFANYGSRPRDSPNDEAAERPGCSLEACMAVSTLLRYIEVRPGPGTDRMKENLIDILSFIESEKT